MMKGVQEDPEICVKSCTHFLRRKNLKRTKLPKPYLGEFHLRSNQLLLHLVLYLLMDPIGLNKDDLGTKKQCENFELLLSQFFLKNREIKTTFLFEECRGSSHSVEISRFFCQSDFT